MYDLLNLLTIDAQIAPYTSSERELLHKHLAKTKAGDLLLMDRGYPSISLLEEALLHELQTIID